MSTSTTLLTAGLACIIAAIVGGGLKAFGIEIPALRSGRRQGLLAALGLILIGAAYAVYAGGAPAAAPREVVLFDTGNDRFVFNNPPQPAEFEISQSYYITYIWTYHWNDERGALPGTIGLRRDDGTMFGPWEVDRSVPGQRDWICSPNTTIPPGRYTIVDSYPSTWSWNPKDPDGVGSDGRGMSRIKGIPAQSTLDLVWYRLGL